MFKVKNDFVFPAKSFFNPKFKMFLFKIVVCVITSLSINSVVFSYKPNDANLKVAFVKNFTNFFTHNHTAIPLHPLTRTATTEDPSFIQEIWYTLAH